MTSFYCKWPQRNNDNSKPAFQKKNLVNTEPHVKFGALMIFGLGVTVVGEESGISAPPLNALMFLNLYEDKSLSR